MEDDCCGLGQPQAQERETHLGIACLQDKSNSRGGCACGKVKQLQTREAVELLWDPLHIRQVSQVVLVVDTNLPRQETHETQVRPLGG